MIKKWVLLTALIFFTLPLSVSAGELNLVEEARENGMNLHWDPLSRSGVLEKMDTTFLFQLETVLC